MATEHRWPLELHPEDGDYPQLLRAIRAWLDAGLVVRVRHNEYATGKEMILCRITAMTPSAGLPVGQRDYLYVSWLYEGSLWIPFGIGHEVDWGYIAGKMKISKWPSDAKSIAAFVINLGRVGTDLPMVTAEGMR